MPSLRIGQLLTLGIFCCSSLTVGNAYLQKGQFYPSVVYLTNSSPSMAVIYAQAAVIVWLMAQAMGKIFFGQLRPAEVEHLFERAWYAVTETCLAFTIFRDDFSPKFVALFVLLLVLKGFHWLSEERVDFMERSPNISLLFHARVLSLLTLLSLLDYAFVRHAYHSVSINGATVQMVFGFEYAILLSSVLYIFIKYVLHSIDSRAETQWENKAVFLLYTELMMSASKVMLYATFMLVMLRIHQFPLFAIRPMYLSVRALKRAFKDVVLSRQAIHNMNTLYPDASEEELVSADNVCIICREEMTGSGNKKLPCNHIFHAACLRSWFQRQQTCPTCRSDVLNVGRSNRRAANGAPRQPEPGNNPVPPGANPNVHPFAIPNLHHLHQYLPQAFLAAHGMFNPLQQQQQQQDRQNGIPQQPAQNANLRNHPNQLQQPLGQQQQPQQPPGGDNSDGNQGGAPGDRPGDPTLNQGGANDGAAAGSGARRGGPRVAPTRPPPPPFFLMPPVFVPPPPPIIPAGINFSALSEEELRAMEGNDRSAVEARIENLRTIQILLDAAVVMMGQNNAMWRASQQASAQSTNAQASSPAAASSPSPEPSSPTASASAAAGATTAATSPVSKTVANGSATPAATGGEKSGDVGGETDESKPSTSSVTSSMTATELEAREIRRRRLEKLAGDRAQD